MHYSNINLSNKEESKDEITEWLKITMPRGAQGSSITISVPLHSLMLLSVFVGYYSLDRLMLQVHRLKSDALCPLSGHEIILTKHNIRPLSVFP